MSLGSAQRTSLYVGDLPVDLPNPEEILNGLFSSVAPVVSLKVCRDLNTQKSLGYAYVNFQNPTDAEKALDALNFTEIVPGRDIRVMYSIRDPIIRKSGTNNLCVKKLDAAITAKQLYTTFSPYGRVLSAKISMDADGNSNGYGFVQFESADAAKSALDMNDKKIGESQVVVESYVRKVDREAEREKTFTNIYAKNIQPSVSDDDVEKAFAVFGAIDTIFVSTHALHQTKFALITYKEHPAAVASIGKLNESTEAPLAGEDNALLVCRALKNSERSRMQRKAPTLYQSQGRNLYIKHLPESVTKEDLEKLFEPFGKVTSCALMKDPSTGEFRGFAFVCYDDKESAVAAMREMNSKSLPDSKRPLYVSQAEQKDMRLRLLQQRRTTLKYQQRMPPPMGMFGQQWGRQFPMMNPIYGGMGGMGGMPPQFMQAPAPPMMRRPMPPMHPQQRPMPMQNRYTQPRQQAPMRPQGSASGLDAAQLANMSAEERMNVLGETLYNRILSINPQQAAKITGMLLEMGTSEILEVLEDNNALLSKVNEALAVLQQHTTN